MKILKPLLFILLSTLVAASAFAQPGIMNLSYYDDGSGGDFTPLGCPCTDGTCYSDGVSICLFWDNNNNGPDPTDIQPTTGTGYGQVNFNCSIFNGEEQDLGCGHFYFDAGIVFTVIVSTDNGDNPLYYLRISSSADSGGNACCWTSSVFTVAPGPHDLNFEYGDWSCEAGECATTIEPPAAPTGVTASDDAYCVQIRVSWQHDGQNVGGFKVYRQGVQNPVATLQPSARHADINVTGLPLVRTYWVTAYNAGGESDASNTDQGSTYLLHFVSGPNGDITGENLHGQTRTLNMERPVSVCPSGAKLILLYRENANAPLQRGAVMDSCELSDCNQVQFTFPNDTTLNFCRVLLVDSSYDLQTLYTDTTDSEFHLGHPLATDLRDLVLPDRFDLAQNYPNPFNPETQIVFNVPVSSDVRIRIYNIAGQLVRTLADNHYGVGVHHLTWDGTNDAGHAVGAGVYLYQMEAPQFTKTMKMLLLK